MNRRRFMHLALGSALAAPWAARRAVAAAAARGASAAAAAVAAAGAAAAAPSGLSLAACTDGLAIARQHILAHCATLAFPSGALHAIRALGRETPLGPGDPFRLVLENYVVETVVSDRQYLDVPINNEGHRHLLIMNLLEKGCEQELEFTLEGRPRRFQELIDSARMLTSYPGNLPIDEHSWTLLALARLTPPAQATWNNAFGTPVDLQRMLDDTSAALWRATELIRTVNLADPDPPRTCPVLGYACGGMHMLAACMMPLAWGYATPERRRTFNAHMQTAMRRLVYDENVIAAVERQNVQVAGAEAARINAFNARVKFLGHLLEVARFAAAHRLYEFSAGERRALHDASVRLCSALVASRDIHFERYKKDRVHYESMTTGLCHAYNALRPGPA
jgi:hypothetical protein